MDFRADGEGYELLAPSYSIDPGDGVPLDPATKDRIVTMQAPDAGEPRLTFTLKVLLESPFIALHIEGGDKMKVLEKALTPGPVAQMPIRAVLQATHPVTLYWAS